MSEHNGSKYAPVPGKIPGTALNLGGRDFVAPPFNLDGVQEVMPLLNGAKDELKTAEDVLRYSARVIHISLKRNYPDLTIDDLLHVIDLGNAMLVIDTICRASGIEFKKPGEPMPASP